MTWKIKDFLYAHRAAIIPVLLLFAGAWYLSRQHRRIADAERRAEAAKLALAGQVVENESTRRALQSDVQDLRSKNADLAAALDTAQRAAPDAKPASVSHLSTGPLVVIKHVTEQVYIPAPSKAEVPAQVDATPPVACAVRDDQRISVDVDQVELVTSKGSAVVVGAAGVYLDEPVRVLLAHGAFKAPLSTSAQLEQPKAPRWGAELTYRCAAGGCGPGAGALFPPFTLPLLGWRVEGRAGASLGAVAGVEGAAGVRF